MNTRTRNHSATLDAKRYQLGKRRSARMTLNASVGVSGHDHQKSPFTMPAQASNLNRHGAAVRVNRELSIGSTIVVRNKYGAELSARIVSLICAAECGTRTYGIEFDKHDEHAKNFWGITFPTA